MNYLPFIFIVAVLLCVGVLYLRKHHLNLSNALWADFSAKLSTEFNALHRRLGDIHAATQAPVTVALLPIAHTPPDPAPAPTQPTAPTPSPNPFVAWKAKGWGIADIQSLPGGLGHAMTDEDWSLAIEAGYHKPAPTPDPDTGPAFVQRPVMTYDECMGQNLTADGNTTITITGCPQKVQIRATQHTGESAGSYDFSVNGVSVHQDMVLASTPINTDTTSTGGNVTVSVKQDPTSHLTIGVGPAP